MFYDKVLLPHTTGSGGLLGTRPTIFNDGKVSEWELEYGTLFETGVLQMLQPMRRRLSARVAHAVLEELTGHGREPAAVAIGMGECFE